MSNQAKKIIVVDFCSSVHSMFQSYLYKRIDQKKVYKEAVNYLEQLQLLLNKDSKPNAASVEEQVCKGCGHLKSIPLKKGSLACCPDNSYVSLSHYLVNSVYKNFSI